MNCTGTLPRLLALLCLAWLLEGCAVLRIDVDVYKGPLANHEDVQVEQMAVMAIGARPLLIQLRNSWIGEEELRRIGETVNTDAYLRPVGGKSPIEPVTDDLVGERRRIKIDAAKRTNAVLFLYEDLDLGGFEPFVLRGKDAIERYENAITKLQVDKERATYRWNKFKTAFSNTANEDLKTAYKALFDPTSFREGVFRFRNARSRDIDERGDRFDFFGI